MITEFQTAINITTPEPLAGDVFVTTAYLFTYPLNHSAITRRRYSLTSPLVR
jgi:hypothetical protein